jgi:PIN domain nuclease of toxin-antitoxin system
MPFHHRDPFDRVIVAQALVENLPIVGRDQAFDSYGVQRIW